MVGLAVAWTIKLTVAILESAVPSLTKNLKLSEVVPGLGV